MEFKQYRWKDRKLGNGVNYGLIADDSPWQIVGPKHNGVNVGALASIDGKAIVEQQKMIDKLTEQVRALEAILQKRDE